ncbi:apolipoprotein C-IV [Pangasianodon hypophthalmus]|uniref:apolipoprotein C-IV n=1 Tax=Pangasianodon hypophthalmus TaxID=310915 RepID=UPI00230797F0|nr:apolipoprotein C-IV [Pangasianodon hypophthalmus]
MSKFVLLAVVMVLQVCLTMADISANATESQGVLERAKEAYKELKTKVVDVGSTAVEFVHMYYEDQVKPVTDPYIEWAKEKARSFWDKIKDKVSRDGSD